MPETFRSAAMIVNAKSRRGQDMFRGACEHLSGLPFPVDAHAVHDPDELEPMLAKALEKRPDLVILGGGDGTISGLVDPLVGRDVVLGVLPIDDDYFANCAAMGISPQIAETIPHHLKRYLGRIGYLGWASLQVARFRPFTLIVDGERVPALEVRISNGPYHGGTELVDSASVDSGEIVVQVVVGRKKRRLVANWGKSILTGRASRDGVREYHGTSLRLDSEPRMPISIDGELLAHTPVTARVAAGVIEVMVPAVQTAGQSMPAPPWRGRYLSGSR